MCEEDDDDDEEVDPDFGPLMKCAGDDKIELKSEMEMLMSDADDISQMLEELSDRV
jgi:hypothetical protein